MFENLQNLLIPVKPMAFQEQKQCGYYVKALTMQGYLLCLRTVWTATFFTILNPNIL